METQKRPREDCVRRDQCLSFIDKLWNADTLAMFHHPVSAAEVPGYYDAIADPIDLSTIKKKIEVGAYFSESDVEDDVARMIANALEFNEKGSKWHELALKMRKNYMGLAQQAGLVIDADSAFIPNKKCKDDESTLRKAEKQCDEELSTVIEDLEKEKEIPLEELRAKYMRASTSSYASDDDDGSDADTSQATSTDDEEEYSDSQSSEDETGDEEESSQEDD